MIRHFSTKLDRDGKHWIFRYDYLRHPASQHPPAHLQIRGKLTEQSVLRQGQPLERVHFPTSGVSLEAIIRVLAVQFGVSQAVTLNCRTRNLLCETRRRKVGDLKKEVLALR
jgi:hypothetical protein